MSMKRLLSIFLILSICMTMTVYAAAERDLTTDEKAIFLNQMSILSGDGTSFKLGDPLLRCEALVFIVRLLGEEDYVKENADNFRDTVFPDVPANAWYAPYVGYCYDLGIVSGSTDGKFYPDRNISEKEFLSLLLRLLGYRSGVDYTWNSVYRAAYEIGIVSDESYISRTEDNLSFKRAGAVDAIFGALKCKIKDSNNTLIHELVSKGVVEWADAEDAGLLVDDTPTEIASVNVLDSRRISVIFNEIVEEITADSIDIYETDNWSEKLSVEIVSQSGNELVLKTSDQTPDIEYTIEISGVIDNEGNFVELVEGTFTGYKEEKIDSDFFRVSGVEAVGKNLLYVYFTHPVNANVEYPGYYEILEEGSDFVRGGFETIVVKCLDNGKNGVSIYLKDRTFTEGTQYTLNISGSLVSQYGTRLNEGMGESVNFYGVSKETGQTGSPLADSLEVTYIYALDKSTIEVGFNMEVDKFFAKQFVNYVVYAPDNTVISVNKANLIEEGEMKGKAVRLGLQGILDKNKEYDLYINFLPDVSKRVSITEKKIRFSGEHPDVTDLKIVNAVASNKRLVVAVVDKPLDPSGAENTSYYSIIDVSNNANVINPVKVHYEVINYSYIVRLYLPADKQLSGNKTYRLRISKLLQFNLGNTSLRDAEYTFHGTNTEYKSPAMSEALIIGSDTIKVTFDGEIAEMVPNVSVNNYTLEYNEGNYTVSKIPLSVTYIDPITIILRFDRLDETVSYRLKAKEICDYAGFSSTAGSGLSIDVKMGKR